MTTFILDHLSLLTATTIKRRYVGPLSVVCQCGQGLGRAQAGHRPTPEFVLTKTLIRKLLEIFIDPSIKLRERETKTKETWKGHQEKSATESAEVVSGCAILYQDFSVRSLLSLHINNFKNLTTGRRVAKTMRL